MKKIILAGLLVAGFVGCNWCEAHYTRTDCTVISTTEGGIMFKDECGNKWFIEGETRGLKLGDKANLKMHTNFTTSDIKDDIILKVEKR